MNWLIALFQAITEGFKFGQELTPSDKIQEEKHEEKKELREQDYNQNMVNDDFNYLKRRTEINIENYLREIHKDVTDGYIQIVTERVHQHRYSHPILFRKWIKENPKK